MFIWNDVAAALTVATETQARGGFMSEQLPGWRSHSDVYLVHASGDAKMAEDSCTRAEDDISEEGWGDTSARKARLKIEPAQ